MGRPELGTKCTCASCGQRFYDLGRSPAVCPKCEAPQPPVVARAVRPARTNSAGAHMSRRPMPVIAEDVEPLAAIEDDVDEDADDDTDVPEIEAEEDTEEDPAIVRD